jgi:hypothetical protein
VDSEINLKRYSHEGALQKNLKYARNKNWNQQQPIHSILDRCNPIPSL